MPQITQAPARNAYLASHVAEIARARGLTTITALSRATGLSRDAASAWWKGVPRILHARVLCLLCKTLNATVEELVEMRFEK